MEEKRMVVIILMGLLVLLLFYGWCFTEKHARVKKWGWWSIGLLTLAFAIFTVWYHTPAVCRDHVQVVEVNSLQEATVEVELIVQRSYLRGTRISGWICLAKAICPLASSSSASVIWAISSSKPNMPKYATSALVLAGVIRPIW